MYFSSFTLENHYLLAKPRTKFYKRYHIFGFDNAYDFDYEYDLLVRLNS